MSPYVRACNDKHIGNIARDQVGSVSNQRYTIIVWPTNGREASRTHHANYGHANIAWRQQMKNMEGISKVHMVDNMLRLTVKRKGAA